MMDAGEGAVGVAAAEAPAQVWAIVEIFGHRKHAGRISEIEQFGAKMLRIDVPTSEHLTAAFVTRIYGGAAIFGITYTDEATARAMNKPGFDPYLARLPSPGHRDEDDEQAELPL